MTDRAKTFLAKTQWADWQMTPIAQDASSRTYMRLSDGHQTVIVMDAPPNTNGSVTPFVDIANYLAKHGLATPAILDQDIPNGFLVLEDLGPTNFASHIASDPADSLNLYKSAADVLLKLATLQPPNLARMTPNIAGDMVRICAEKYVPSPALADDLADKTATVLSYHCGPADTLALRDYHVENLIWRPEKQGLKQVGLLDFQDAFIAPFGYDLASLLFDARRDVDPTVLEQTTNYFAKQSSQSKADLDCWIACLSAQRNLRILGVFARLINDHNKHRYAEMLPRVWGHVMHCIQHPALDELRPVVLKGIPDPMTTPFAAWIK